MREPHILTATKTARLPKRVIFFDSESEVETRISDTDIQRAAAAQASKQKGGGVRKHHSPYLICAEFHKTEDGRSVRQDRRVYNAPQVKGEAWEGGSSKFSFHFWQDVARFTTLTEKVYAIAHNAKYDVMVTGALKYLVEDMGYEVVSFSDANPFFLELEKIVTHSSRTGKLYGEYVDEMPDEPEHGWHPKRTPIPLKDGTWFVPKPKSRKIMLLSSTNYYQQSLASLGKVFGIKKLDFDHDQTFTQAEAIAYCWIDVEILRTAMLSFLSFIVRENLGSFSVTVAGQAFGAYRRRFMPEDLIHIHADARALRVEREAYAGGRTEVFRMGEIPNRSYYVDVNSMYPHVMESELYPVKLVTFWHECTIDRLRRALDDGFLICCEAYVDTDEPVYFKKDKRLIFPTGKFWTALSTPEIKYALAHGHLIKIKNVCVYEGENIFSDFVNYFYKMRLRAKHDGDAVHDFLYKIFLNSLYGKFGQRNIKWEPVGDAPPTEISYERFYHAPTKEVTTFKTFGGKVWKEGNDEDASEAYNSFPAVAAHVTSHARMLLWSAIKTAGRDRVNYTDTDSLFTDDIGYQELFLNNFLDNGILGKLKLEDYGSLTLYGCKDYIFISETEKDKNNNPKITVKIKGISKNAVPLENSDKGKLRFAVTQWGGFTDRIKEGDFEGYYNKIVIKELARDYNKGVIGEGGFITPYLLNEPQRESSGINIVDLIDTYGYIREPDKKNKFYSEFNKLPTRIKYSFFRLTKGETIAAWCGIAAISAAELFNQLNQI